MDRIAILGLLQHRLPGLQAVYAFGSRSQGTGTSRSDLDLAVLTPERLDPVALWELQVLRDKQELDELRAPLVEEILRSGVVHGG